MKSTWMHQDGILIFSSHSSTNYYVICVKYTLFLTQLIDMNALEIIVSAFICTTHFFLLLTYSKVHLWDSSNVCASHLMVFLSFCQMAMRMEGGIHYVQYYAHSTSHGQWQIFVKIKYYNIFSHFFHNRCLYAVYFVRSSVQYWACSISLFIFLAFLSA